MTASDVIAVQQSYITGLRKVAPNSRYGLLCATRLLLLELKDAGAPDLSYALQKVQMGKPRAVVPTPRELEVMLQVPDLATRWVVTCAAEIGLRSGTALAVRFADVQGDRIVVRTKNQRVANVPISDGVRRLLMLVPPGCDSSATVVDLLNRRPLASPKCTISTRLKRWKASMDVREEVKPHDCRRAFARQLFAATGDLRVVQTMLSHKTLQSTFWYLDQDGAAVTSEVLNEALKRRTR